MEKKEREEISRTLELITKEKDAQTEKELLSMHRILTEHEIQMEMDLEIKSRDDILARLDSDEINMDILRDIEWEERIQYEALSDCSFLWEGAYASYEDWTSTWKT